MLNPASLRLRAQYDSPPAQDKACPTQDEQVAAKASESTEIREEMKGRGPGDSRRAGSARRAFCRTPNKVCHPPNCELNQAVGDVSSDLDPG